jgi:hypothetical protein
VCSPHLPIVVDRTVHLSIDGHLGCMHFLAIVNTAGMNVGVKMFLRSALKALDTYPEVELVNKVVCFYLFFLAVLRFESRTSSLLVSHSTS